MSKKLLNEKETSEYISMSRSYLRQSRLEGSTQDAPKWVKIGERTIRYRIDDLDEWADGLEKGKE